MPAPTARELHRRLMETRGLDRWMQDHCITLATQAAPWTVGQSSTVELIYKLRGDLWQGSA